MTSVLILAGSRNEDCPLCAAMGVSSKALVPLAGVRMIDHMLRALRDTPELTGNVWISGLDLAALADGAPPDLADFITQIKACPEGVGPADATLKACAAGAGLPLLITTCDHPLLTPEMIRAVLEGGADNSSALVVGLASRSVISEAYPETKRTYINLGGEGYSGCNIFLIQTEEGMRAVDFWREVGRDRKKPLRLAQHFGYRSLLRMLFGRLSLQGAFEYGSKRVGAKLHPVVIPIAEAAIDVDKPEDLSLVSAILSRTN